jgi:hypothetical protein
MAQRPLADGVNSKYKIAKIVYRRATKKAKMGKAAKLCLVPAHTSRPIYVLPIKLDSGKRTD